MSWVGPTEKLQEIIDNQTSDFSYQEIASLVEANAYLDIYSRASGFTFLQVLALDIRSEEKGQNFIKIMRFAFSSKTKANPNLRSRDGFFSLIHILLFNELSSRYLHAFLELANGNVDVEAKFQDPQKMGEFPPQFYTPLQMACIYSGRAQYKFMAENALILLKHGANPQVMDDAGNSLVMLSVKKIQGSTSNVYHPHDSKPYNDATTEKRTKYRYKHAPRYTYNNSGEALVDENLLYILLHTYHVNPNVPNQQGRTALVEANQCGASARVCTLLLEYGANPRDIIVTIPSANMVKAFQEWDRREKALDLMLTDTRSSIYQKLPWDVMKDVIGHHLWREPRL